MSDTSIPLGDCDFGDAVWHCESPAVDIDIACGCGGRLILQGIDAGVADLLMRWWSDHHDGPLCKACDPGEEQGQHIFSRN